MRAGMSPAETSSLNQIIIIYYHGLLSHITTCSCIIPCLRAGMSLAETVAAFRPNILLGLSTVPGIFDETVVRKCGSLPPSLPSRLAI